MIHRDYILRMIEEFVRMLARIRSLKKGRRCAEASEDLDTGFKQLMGEGAEAVARLTEAELLARIMRDGPTHLVRDKTLMLATLLKEAGDIAVAREQTENRLAADRATKDGKAGARTSLSPSGRGEPSPIHSRPDGRECYLKALHLLLGALARDEPFECPEFVPNVEMLREALQGTPLPAQTHALLMQHYERTGEFAKAEDELFAMLDAEPDNGVIVEFGIAFYQRLLARSDAALAAANLPRAEVEEGLRELQRRRK